MNTCGPTPGTGAGVQGERVWGEEEEKEKETGAQGVRAC